MKGTMTNNAGLWVREGIENGYKITGKGRTPLGASKDYIHHKTNVLNIPPRSDKNSLDMRTPYQQSLANDYRHLKQ